MIHRIRKPSALIAAIAAAQALLLMVGVLFFAAWMRSTVSNIVYQQVLDDNVQTARQITGLIQKMDAHDLRDNPDTWRRLQELIGGIELPNDGFVCLVDARNSDVLCHPDFNGLDGPLNYTYPRRPGPGRLPTSVPARGNAPRVDGAVRDHLGEVQIIAAARVAGPDVNINVHQKASGVDARIE